MSTASLAAWSKSKPNQLISIVVGIVLIGAAAWVGLKARSAAGLIRDRRPAWEQTAYQLATVQQQFRVPSSTESAALLAEATRMGALAVPKGDKLNLVDIVGRLAEASSLSDVQGFSIRTGDGRTVDFRMGHIENAASFPPGHLAEHKVSLVPVRVTYVEQDGSLVALRLEDAR